MTLTYRIDLDGWNNPHTVNYSEWKLACGFSPVIIDSLFDDD